MNRPLSEGDRFVQTMVEAILVIVVGGAWLGQCSMHEQSAHSRAEESPDINSGDGVKPADPVSGSGANRFSGRPALNSWRWTNPISTRLDRGEEPQDGSGHARPGRPPPAAALTSAALQSAPTSQFDRRVASWHGSTIELRPSSPSSANSSTNQDSFWLSGAGSRAPDEESAASVSASGDWPISARCPKKLLHIHADAGYAWTRDGREQGLSAGSRPQPSSFGRTGGTAWHDRNPAAAGRVIPAIANTLGERPSDVGQPVCLPCGRPTEREQRLLSTAKEREVETAGLLRARSALRSETSCDET